MFLQAKIGRAFRLQRTNIVSWAVGVFLLSAPFGAVLGDLEKLFADLGILQGLLSGTVPVIMTVLKLKNEEKNLAESYFRGAVSRTGLLGSYIFQESLWALLYNWLLCFVSD